MLSYHTQQFDVAKSTNLSFARLCFRYFGEINGEHALFIIFFYFCLGLRKYTTLENGSAEKCHFPNMNWFTSKSVTEMTPVNNI